MSADPSKIALYLQGTFDTSNPDPEQKTKMKDAARSLGSSGFGTVILGQFHVHDDGTIYYNNTRLDDARWAVSTIPTILKKSGSVENVLLTFGPSGNDFQGIETHLSSFKQTISDLRSAANLDGLDWDLEEDYDRYSNLLVHLTNWAAGSGMKVTAAPYQMASVWTEVLAKTNGDGGTSDGFAWWNLQLYGGAVYERWVNDIHGLVPNPESFLVPGYNVVGSGSPSFVQNRVHDLRQSHSSLDGGFIWKYEGIQSRGQKTAAYAHAIRDGLSG